MVFNGFHHLFTAIRRMVYYCFTHMILLKMAHLVRGFTMRF